MSIDLNKFKGALPYASELYGVYQPLLGWKSALVQRRIESGLLAVRKRVNAEILARFSPDVELQGEPDEGGFRIGLAQERPRTLSALTDVSGSLIAGRVLGRVERAGNAPDAWRHFTSEQILSELLNELREPLLKMYGAALETLLRTEPRGVPTETRIKLMRDILSRESIAAGALHFLGRQENLQGTMALAATELSSPRAIGFLQTHAVLSAFLDPRHSALARAVVSPIGVAHLFRQFFFEFDTFLGPPVEHLWLSGGGTVELIEVSTRRTLTERTAETGIEAVSRSETSVTQQDELSEAVRSENASNTRFGVSLNTNTSFGSGPVFNTSIGTGTSFNLDDSQKDARESLHKGLRQQTEKISTELKRSFKSTFRTVTEVTDTKSRRYVIQNTTKDLVNYELRRKMRQVGVQVQDIGTHLCWQTYVDWPGDELGVANLIHIATPGDLQPKQQPELQPPPEPYKGDPVKISFDWPFSDDEDDPNLYDNDFIARQFEVFPKLGFKLTGAGIAQLAGPIPNGFHVRLVDERSVAPSDATVTEKTPIKIVLIQLRDQAGKNGLPRMPRWPDHPHFEFEITPRFEPSQWLVAKINGENAAKLKNAKEATEREYKEKLLAAVAERVTQASKIGKRKFEDLREEERVVVYRALIGQLLDGTGLEHVQAEPRVRHIFAELVQSMFDVEKMLYFVAPEWWVPRIHANRQTVFVQEKTLGGAALSETEFVETSTVSWGGGASERPDNYYITKDSDPAPMGSSLGWVIQLDGDNMRNAFLNAPWVKAVIPIREGKEKEAFEWLSASQVEGADGLDSVYQPGDPGELNAIRTELSLPVEHQITIRDALNYLIARLQKKRAVGRTHAQGEDGADLGYLPAEQVYEHGFYPLQGGFRAAASKPFEVFDQWVEIVPTDQIVPVAVEYDPVTGRLKPPTPGPSP